MNNLQSEIRDLVIERLDEFKGSDHYLCDLGHILFESENSTGSVFCNAHMTKEWIKEHFEDLSEPLENMEFNGLSYANPFKSPETFHVQVLLEVSSSMLSKCSLIQDDWDNCIELTDDVVETLTEQLNALEDVYS